MFAPNIDISSFFLHQFRHLVYLFIGMQPDFGPLALSFDHLSYGVQQDIPSCTYKVYIVVRKSRTMRVLVLGCCR